MSDPQQVQRLRPPFRLRVTKSVRELLGDLILLADRYDIANAAVSDPELVDKLKAADDRAIVSSHILNVAYHVAQELKKPRRRKKQAKEVRNGGNSAGENPVSA